MLPRNVVHTLAIGWGEPVVDEGLAVRPDQPHAGEAVLRQGEGPVERPRLAVDEAEVVVAPHPQPAELMPVGSV